jgi:competence protein ComEC
VTARAVLVRSPHCLVAALCAGITAANVVRGASPLLAVAGVAAVGAAAVSSAGPRVPLLAAGLALCGWWWGSARLDALDRSVLLAEAGMAERGVVVVTSPVRRGRFELRATGQVRRFGPQRLREPVQLQMPLGRAPPQGAILVVLAQIGLPRGPDDGFDERMWLRRRGIHVVLKVDRWHQVGRRRGLAGATDRLRAWLGRSVAPGLHGQRKAILTGILLGDDQDLSDDLRDRFRASGLYHLLAVSGQNVALVAAGVVLLAYLLGVSRLHAQVAAIAAMAAYVLAVGAQPSVVRAGIAGGLASLAWLSGRATDRWYFLLLGGLALLAWNPYVIHDPGFQLSFGAVVAIFTLTPRIRLVLEGYPVPAWAADAIAVSGACGLVTAPIAWLQFHAIPLLAVPANALAAPVVGPLLGLALATVAVSPFAPSAAAALAWLNGWCAAYLAACAGIVSAVPFAQVTSGVAAAALGAGALLAAAYAWLPWRRS